MTNTVTNTELLKSFYTAFSKKDIPAMLSHCSEDVTFQIQGKSKLAGKYTRSNVSDLFTKMSELSQNTFHLEIHDIMSSDQHGLVLTTNSISRNGTKSEYRAVHVWRIQNGKLVAWYDYPRDLYQHDAIWG